MTTTLVDALGGGTEATVHHEGGLDAVPPVGKELGQRMVLNNLANLVEGGAGPCLSPPWPCRRRKGHLPGPRGRGLAVTRMSSRGECLGGSPVVSSGGWMGSGIEPLPWPRTPALGPQVGHLAA